MPIDYRRLSPNPAGDSGLINPASIEGLVVWYDASDVSTLAGDTAGNTAITSNGASVAYIRNKAVGLQSHATNATQATSANRPTWRTDGHPSLGVLLFDGTNDSLSSTFSLTSGITWFLVAEPVISGDGFLISHGNSGNSPGFASGFQNTSDFPRIASAYEVVSSSTVKQSVANTASGYSVLSTVMTASGVQTARRNGAEVSRLGTGPAFPASSTHFLGAAGASTENANFRFGEALYFNRELTDFEVQSVERYLASRWSITLPTIPTSTNADAQNWLNRVYLNGGTVSASTISAVQAFTNSIDSQGLRGLIHRVNLFCGDSLSSAVVPLYRGPSLTAATIGHLVDQNQNFVTGDFVEATGLIGDANTKILVTGISQNFDTSRHLAACVTTNTTAAVGARYMMGAFSATGTTDMLAIYQNNAGGLLGFNYEPSPGTGTSGSTAITNVLGRLFQINSTPGASGFSVFLNGSQHGSSLTGYAASNAGHIAVFTAKRVTNGGTIVGLATNARMGGYSIGNLMTSAQSSSYNSIWTTFSQALGRTT